MPAASPAPIRTGAEWHESRRNPREGLTIMAAVTAEEPRQIDRRELKSVVVRFAGDSGDGMQLTGGQFTLSTALAGNDLATFPDFPGRDPRAARHDLRRLGVPDQFRLAARSTPRATQPDVLVAMNPAALKTNLADAQARRADHRRRGRRSTSATSTRPATTTNPLEDGSLGEVPACWSSTSPS